MLLLNFIPRWPRWKTGHLQRCVSSHQKNLTHFYFILSHQVVQSAKALQWIMDSLKSRGYAAKEALRQQPTSSFIITVNLHISVIILQIYNMSNLLLCGLFPAALIMTDESPDTLRNMSEKEDRFHVNARQFHYPNSKVTRFPVPEEKVPWEVFHINFHRKITSCWSSEHHCIKKKMVWVYWILVVFMSSFFFQVSFSSYMPSYYASEDSGDQVDGYVFTKRRPYIMSGSY